jgi:hypothetical protein
VIRHEIGYTTLQGRGTGLMCVTGEFTLTKTKNVRRHEFGYTSPQQRGFYSLMSPARNDLLHLSVCHCSRSGKRGAGQQADCGG